jgi:hypothetical protein
MAHDQARGSGRELRIVVSSAAMLDQFVLAGLDSDLLIYPSLSLASRLAPCGSSGHLTWRD